MSNVISKLKELEFEKILWFIFIFVSALNIYGDQLEELFITERDFKNEEIAKKIFTFTVAISLIIYLYFAYRNYKNLKEVLHNNEDTALYMVRFVGSILVVVGATFILYFQVNEPNSIGTPAV